MTFAALLWRRASDEAGARLSWAGGLGCHRSTSPASRPARSCHASIRCSIWYACSTTIYCWFPGPSCRQHKHWSATPVVQTAPNPTTVSARSTRRTTKRRQAAMYPDMQKINALGVYLEHHRIGIINRLAGERHLFAFEQDYADDRHRPTLSLSYKSQTGGLVTSVRPVSRRLPPFFSNLLPEGPLRTYLARKAGVKPEREFF